MLTKPYAEPVLAHPTGQLCHFAASLRLDDIPAPVIVKMKALLVDWLGSCLAGKNAPQVVAIENFAALMGPASGPCRCLPGRQSTSPLFAAMVNAAASHVVEQDDVHNGSVFHPATVVFPAALAVAQAEGACGADFLLAAIVGYEVGIRVGEFLGRSHYEIFHTTGTAGTVAAAAAAGKLMGLDAGLLNHALGSAGTQAAGLWEFLRDAADSKQLHTAKAAADGLLSAYLARDGFKGASRILEGPQGMGAGMARNANPSRLLDGLGTRWATLEMSYKWHASCRHTHPAADALAALMTREKLAHGEIARVITRVHQGAIDVLGPVVNPRTIHQAKFSMGTVLGLIAVHGAAGLGEFEQHGLLDARVSAFCQKVSMVLDDEVNTRYPRQWIGKVDVVTQDGRHHTARVDEPRGDPGNMLSEEEIAAKAIRLAAFRGAATEVEMRAVLERIQTLEKEPDLRFLLAAA